MKLNKYIKIMAAALVLAGGGLTACESDDIQVSRADEGGYQSSVEPVAYVVSQNGKRQNDLLEFRNSGKVNLYVGVTKAASADVHVSLEYAPAVLERYNNQNGTAYQALPQELVTISKDALLVKGEKQSGAIGLSVTTHSDLDATATYVVPLKGKVSGGGVELSVTQSEFLLFVKDCSKVPDCDKASGIKVFSCMEVNDTNPLNNLCFTLKNSGKYLVDAVILFSSNINYNAETGKVYVFHNENVQHLLDNREKYLKPLKDHGMKVILSILGNHDRSGVANLGDEAARAFALEIKAICDAYDLDGVFFDDEYSDYENPVPPGFVRPSSAAASRLFYECKQAMPDKWTIAYAYASTSMLPSIEGQLSGTFVDYGLHDYRGSSDLSSNYPGMPKMNMGLYSQEFNRGYWASESDLKEMRANGYGSHMIFAMDPYRLNFSSQLSAMQKMARAFYDDELVFDGNRYRKDW